ncbi:hypothetical protein [Luteimonas terricola]|uniref:Uncharacterized protein n=1 Tax=Luteimonas terricola TaxID=645597 RepID=A0ABQ2EDI8_9GAMM|nr:hypothetical protein [Luteimonas terricola]GGK06971.1 hypothetical protein GCM10011394_15230 [Luteimonas terricola]
MPHRKQPDSDTPASDKPDREERSYPHSSGDRNAWSPTRKDPMPKHEGGTQRKAPPGPDERG